MSTTAVYNKKGDVSVEPAAADGKMILRNVRILEEGIAKGHGVFMDESFVDDLIALAANRRIKSRFGHPGMCSEAFGTYIGYFDNFRKMKSEEGYYAIADLHLSSAAKISPNGNLSDYIYQLANEAPDMFGNSIVFDYDTIYYKTDKGYNVIRKYEGDEDDEDDTYYGRSRKFSWVLYRGGEEYEEEKHGKVDTEKPYVNIIELNQSDLVDEPAATSALFSEQSFVQKIFQFFGGNREALKKTALLKQLILTFNNQMKLDINARTADGTSIIVQTENDFIGVNDTVTDSEGNPVADGSHDIAESDSNQSGITITTSGGVITRIEPTMASEEEPVQASEGDAANADALGAKVAQLTSQLAAISQKLAANAKQYAAIIERLEKIEEAPAADRTVVIPNEKKDEKLFTVKKPQKTGYGWSV